MIAPYKIKFNELFSHNLGVNTCFSFDSDNGEIETYLGREAIVSETYNGALKRGYTYKWSESLSLTLTFIKDNFEEFTYEENRRILKWLTSKQTASFLDVYTDDSDIIAYSVLGNFVTINQYKLSNDRIVGYTAIFESLTPYAFSRLHTIDKTIAQPEDRIITIYVDTDEPNEAIYPRITIKHSDKNYIPVDNGVEFDIHSDMINDTVYYNGTKYYWKTLGASKMQSTRKPVYDWPIIEVDHAYDENDTWNNGEIYKYDNTYYWLDSNSFYALVANPNLNTTSIKLINRRAVDGDEPSVATCSVAHNVLGETVVLDGANRLISSSRPSRIFGEDFIGWEWLPLYNGTNEIEVIGDCDIIIEYREIRKIGSI